MILNSPYISGSLTVTGNTTIQGQLTVTGSLSGTASLASNALLLQGTGSTGFATTASVLQVSSSQQEISASLLQVSASYISLSGSYNTFSGSASTRITVDSASLLQVSASYIALSGSYNTFSGSASTRTTQIEQVYATTGSNSFRANQSITGSLVVSSTITAQTLIVQTVTSSIVYSSGSNIFGCDLNSRQTFTGSLNVTGSTTLNGALTGTSATFNGDIAYNNVGNQNLIITSGAANNGRMYIYSAGNADIGFQASGSSWFLNKLGIGTNAPSDLLHIEKCQAGGMGMIIRNSCGATSNTSMCSLISLQLVGTGQTGQIGVNLIAGKEGDYSSAGTRNAFFAIQTACGDNLYERLRITSIGNVGIGTTSPAFQLDVCPGVANTTIRAGSYAIMQSVTTNQAMFGLNIAYATSIGSGWRYINTENATAIRMYSGDIIFHLAASGVAGTQPATWDTTDAKMTIKNNGNVGIATSNPESYLAAKLVVSTTCQNDGITIVTNNSTYSNNLFFARGTSGSDRSRGAVGYNHNTDTLSFVTNDTARMSINCVGDVTIGQGESRHLTIDSTSGSYSYLYLKGGTNDGYLLQNINGCTSNGVAAGAMYIYMSQAQNFEFVWSAVSKIKFTSTGLSCFAGTVCAPCFATISDYRMKSNIRPIEGLSIIMNTKPYKFEYNYDCSTSFGMIAHELQDTLPEAVFGQKDGEVMQGVDYMKLLPIAIKAIQELNTKFEEYKTTHP